MKHRSHVVCWTGMLLVAAASAGCGAVRGSGTHPGADSASADSLPTDSLPRFVDVQVDNHNWSDVVIYVIHGGMRTRLGTAGTARGATFQIPASWVFADRVSLLATPIGSPSSYQTERFKVFPGQRVILTLESTLSRSSLMIR